jgi:hypothetical protein
MRVLGKDAPLPAKDEQITANEDNPNSGSFIMLSPTAAGNEGFSTAANEPVTVEDEPDDLLQQQPASPVAAAVPQAHAATPIAAAPETRCQRQARTAAAKLKDIDWKYWALQVAKFIAQLAVFGILARGVIPPTAPVLSTGSSASSSSSTDAALHSRVASLEQLVREQGAQLLVSFV